MIETIAYIALSWILTGMILAMHRKEECYHKIGLALDLTLKRYEAKEFTYDQLEKVKKVLTFLGLIVIVCVLPWAAITGRLK